MSSSFLVPGALWTGSWHLLDVVSFACLGFYFIWAAKHRILNRARLEESALQLAIKSVSCWLWACLNLCKTCIMYWINEYINCLLELMYDMCWCCKQEWFHLSLNTLHQLCNTEILLGINWVLGMIGYHILLGRGWEVPSMWPDLQDFWVWQTRCLNKRIVHWVTLPKKKSKLRMSQQVFALGPQLHTSVCSSV